jgi:hypothetical protein
VPLGNPAVRLLGRKELARRLFYAAHGLFEMENSLGRSTGQTGKPLTDEVLHTLSDVGFLEKGITIPLGGYQLVKLFNLIAELNRQCIRLQLTSIFDSFHRVITPLGTLFSMVEGFPGASTFNPIVNLLFSEFPESSNFMGRHTFFADPLIGSVTLAAKVFSDFAD